MIRQRTQQDLACCVTALRTVHDADGYPSVWPPDPARWLAPTGVLTAWVAESAGKIVGHILARDGGAEPELAEAVGVVVERLVVVARLFVVSSARGTGVAEELVDQVRAYARERGCRTALDVVADAASAIAFYERTGWRCVGSGVASWVTDTGEHPVLRYFLAP